MYSSLQGCHTATGTHVPYGITQCYLPPGRGDNECLWKCQPGTCQPLFDEHLCFLRAVLQNRRSHLRDWHSQRRCDVVAVCCCTAVAYSYIKLRAAAFLASFSQRSLNCGKVTLAMISSLRSLYPANRVLRADKIASISGPVNLTLGLRALNLHSREVRVGSRNPM